MESFKSGVTIGNGAAINVELGWIPDRVEVYNATTGTPYNVAFPNRMVLTFTSGGTNEISVGETIKDLTTLATAIVAAIVLTSGSWAAATAAGIFVLERDYINGSFGANACVGEEADATDDFTAAAVQAEHGFTSTGAVAAANSSIVAYVGVAGSKSKGFTIAAGLAIEAKVLRWAAYRDDR